MATQFQARLGVSQWVLLPETLRRRLADLFHLEANGGAIVENGKLKQDRHTEKDLQGITIEKMQELVKSDSKNFFELFDRVLEYVENEQVDLSKLNEEQLAKAKEIAQKTAVETAIQTMSALSEAVAPLVKKQRAKK